MALFEAPIPAHAAAVNDAPRLQRTRAATEAVSLMLAHAFETLGYRRFEWNATASTRRRAKLRCGWGFRIEGIFRQATIYKGRSRDTAWFSILDGEWPALKQAYRAWLAPGNFDEAGRQRTRLSERSPPCPSPPVSSS